MSSTDTKPWWQSKTIIAGIVAIVLSAVGAFGVGIPEGQQEPIVELVFQLVTAIAGIVVIIGRITAKKELTK